MDLCDPDNFEISEGEGDGEVSVVDNSKMCFKKEKDMSNNTSIDNDKQTNDCEVSEERFAEECNVSNGHDQSKRVIDDDHIFKLLQHFVKNNHRVKPADMIVSTYLVIHISWLI